METKQQVIARLKKNILTQQGYKPGQIGRSQLKGLEEIEAAFPNGIFPTGMIHEMLCERGEQAAACSGFLAALLAALIGSEGIILWISSSRFLFPPAMKIFGIEPHQVVFVDVANERQVLWAFEEGLKCEGFAAVIAELGELSFAQSKRLQLATEESHVTGFVLRSDPHRLTTTTCVSRWRISSVQSEMDEGMPGVGFPRWRVELLRVRNGQPGLWHVEWHGNQFRLVLQPAASAITFRELQSGGLRA